MSGKSMPPAVHELFEEFRDEVATLNLRYRFFVQLFGTQELVALLNDFAPALFETVYEVMLEHLLLRRSHLTDPARVKSNPKKANQSLFLLMETVEQDSPGLTTALGLEEDLDELKKACEGIRELRNRLLAHRDWGRRAEPLPGVSRSQMDRALEKFGRIMNAVSMHYRDIEVRFSDDFADGTGDDLVHHLRDLARRLDDEEGQWRR